MMSFKKTLIGLAALASIAGAQAAIVNVAGVVFDAGTTLTFGGRSDNATQQIQNGFASGNPLTGFGEITKINQTDNFGGTLTYTFSGYNFQSQQTVDTNLRLLAYNGGTFNIFFTPTGQTQNTNNPWLILTGAAINGSTLGANFRTNGNVPTGNVTGGGFLNVAGGTAASFFDTNAYSGGSDFSFSTTFTDSNGVLGTTGVGYTRDLSLARGVSTFSGTLANNVPEPASLALVGLGLVGLAAARRKASKK